MWQDNRVWLALAFTTLVGIFFVSRLEWSTGPRLYPASGTLLIGGQPASKVQVHFLDLEGKAELCSAQVDDEGKFYMYWGRDGRSGAEPGRYKLVLAQMSGSTAPVYVGPDAKVIPNISPHTFPPEFLAAETSTYDLEVLKQTNVFEIDIPLPPEKTGPRPSSSNGRGSMRYDGPGK